MPQYVRCPKCDVGLHLSDVMVAGDRFLCSTCRHALLFPPPASPDVPAHKPLYAISERDQQRRRANCAARSVTPSTVVKLADRWLGMLFRNVVLLPLAVGVAVAVVIEKIPASSFILDGLAASLEIDENYFSLCIFGTAALVTSVVGVIAYIRGNDPLSNVWLWLDKQIEKPDQR